MSDDFFGSESMKGGASSSSFSSEQLSRMQGIDNWMKTKDDVQDVVALVYGIDGTMKTGLALSFPVKSGEKIVVIDIDGGAIPIARQFHKDKYMRGEIIVKNPVIIDENTLEIDYDATIKQLMGSIEWVKRNWQKENIKLFVLDGVSSLLKICEWRMKEMINKQTGDGVEMRFWQIRARIFTEILTAVKSLPVNVIYIAHENFIISDSADKVSSVVQRINQMCFQKIRMSREASLSEVKYTCIVDKSKYRPAYDNKKYDCLIITEKEQKMVADKFWQELLG